MNSSSHSFLTPISQKWLESGRWEPKSANCVSGFRLLWVVPENTSSLGNSLQVQFLSVPTAVAFDSQRRRPWQESCVNWFSDTCHSLRHVMVQLGRKLPSKLEASEAEDQCKVFRFSCQKVQQKVKIREVSMHISSDSLPLRKADRLFWDTLTLLCCSVRSLSWLLGEPRDFSQCQQNIRNDVMIVDFEGLRDLNCYKFPWIDGLIWIFLSNSRNLIMAHHDFWCEKIWLLFPTRTSPAE